MPLPATSDPARRYRAIEAAALRARENGETYDVFDALVESVYAVASSRMEQPSEEAPNADAENLERVRAGVRSAIASYDTPTVREMFDACLLAGATESQLASYFAVDPLETIAYKHLFFDRDVFPNAFHIVAYIASRQDEGEKRLLRIAQSQGFEALAAQYGVGQSVTPESALQNVLLADAAAYQRYRELPITHQSVKDVRALGKQVVATAQAMQKVQDSRAALAARTKTRKEDEEFVLIAAPPNPTLEELLASGGALATPADETLA